MHVLLGDNMLTFIKNKELRNESSTFIICKKLNNEGKQFQCVCPFVYVFNP